MVNVTFTPNGVKASNAANTVKILSPDTVKQGDTKNDFLVQLIKDGVPLDLTGKTVTWSAASNKGKFVTDRAATVEGDGTVGIEFTGDDVGATGSLRVEFKVAYPDGDIEKFPAQDYAYFQITRSLDDLSHVPVMYASVQYFEDKVTETQALAVEAQTAASTAETAATTAQASALTAEEKAVAMEAQISQLATDGPVLSVNGQSGIVEGLATQQSVDGVTAQLADTENKVQKVKERSNTEIIANRNRRPMITIIDDDGRSDFLTTWKPILEEKQAKVSIGVVTSAVGTANYMSWSELEQLKNELDVDLINHTHTHPSLGDLTEEELRYQFDQSKEILKSRGHNYDIMVYPYGSASVLSRKIAREYFRAGIYISGGVIVPPVDTFMLNRLSLMPQTGVMEPLETYKAYIDEAIAKNGWIIFMTHCFYPTWDAEKIKALIDYANSTSIEWVHTHEGLDSIGNIIDYGDYHYRAAGAEYTVMDANGVIHSSTNSKDYVLINARNLKPVFNTPLTDFPIGLSTAVVQTAEATGFPVSGGMLETFRGGESGGILLYNYQLYHPYYSNKVYKRTWNRTNLVWSAFEEVGTGGTGGTSGESLHITSATDAFTLASLITSFTAGKITYTRISGSNSGIASFPDGEYGVLITNRLYTDGYAFQEYHTASGTVYYREYSTAWSAWSRYIRGSTLTVTIPSITLAPGAVGDSSATVPEIAVTDIISGCPNTVLESGVMYSILKQAGVIRVRFHNTTASEITLAARNWNFTRVRSNSA